MLPIQRKISAYNHSAGNNIQYIVIHYTGNKGDTALNNAIYFNRGDRQSSAHYFVDDNSIWQVVEDSNAAWHVGDGGERYGIGNHNSIGIEQCCMANGEISVVTESNCVELTKYLMKKYNINVDHVVRHYDASRKICPNWSANNWARWWKFKEKLSSNELEGQELLVNLKEYFVDDYYRENNPDVVKAYGTSHEALYRHYIEFGKKEGRKPNAYPEDWNEAYYLINNPDVLANVNTGMAFTSGLHHYIIIGYKEGRSYAKPDILEENTDKDRNSSDDLANDSEIFYRVISGSYKNRKNAEKKARKLKEAGFESFIDMYNNSKKG